MLRNHTIGSWNRKILIAAQEKNIILIAAQEQKNIILIGAQYQKYITPIAAQEKNTPASGSWPTFQTSTDNTIEWIQAYYSFLQSD